ncbi:MAG: hypothetical protein HF981_11045 [Desulfobacteraceae bacterium]|nr:hypothetical protein [Desulfobacteraceae bacterium]MBC2750910.1 hypothetical protein [Desulfobacteraceae bacterium]
MGKRFDKEFKIEAVRLASEPGNTDDEMQRLKRENERLRRERDILKKAVAIFSEDPNRYSDS